MDLRDLILLAFDLPQEDINDVRASGEYEDRLAVLRKRYKQRGFCPLVQAAECLANVVDMPKKSIIQQLRNAIISERVRHCRKPHTWVDYRGIVSESKNAVFVHPGDALKYVILPMGLRRSMKRMDVNEFYAAKNLTLENFLNA